MHPFKNFRLSVTPKSTKTLASIFMAGFMLLHLLMFAILGRHGVTPFRHYSIVSFFIYPLLFFLLYREYWRTYAVLIVLHSYTYAGFAVYHVGWDAGFQLAFIPLIVLCYYAEYSAHIMKVRTLHAFSLSCVGALAYLALLVLCHVREAPPYPLPEATALRIRMVWTLVEFTVIIAYLQVFMTIAHTAQDSLARMANHDQLTSLPNRYYMASYLDRMSEAQGLANRWVAMADIDDFKQVNDTHGHNCGDYVLKTLASILQQYHESFVACRWGGEEFLLTGCADAADQTEELLESLRQHVQDYDFAYKGTPLDITITIGYAPYATGQTADAWINEADRRLYAGKCNGKNQVVR